MSREDDELALRMLGWSELAVSRAWTASSAKAVGYFGAPSWSRQRFRRIFDAGLPGPNWEFPSISLPRHEAVAEAGPEAPSGGRGEQDRR